MTGAAVLIVEILGAKMLAPYLGTSHFVWTAQIAVTLLSLATGYWFGGRLVDRGAQLGRLYLCILGAATYLAATVPIAERVAYASFRFSLPVASVLSSFFLFFVPLTLLAAVVPFLIRVLSQSLEGIGGLAGRLSAVSTSGSVLGTVLIGYVFVPHLATSTTMLSLAAGLTLCALVYFVSWGRRARYGHAGLLLATLAVGVSSRAPGDQLKVRRNYEELARQASPFGLVQVWRNRHTGYLALSTDFLLQNNYDDQRHKSPDVFSYMLRSLARQYGPEISDVLVIGLGIGVLPMAFALDGARVDAVEINPVVADFAARFFEFEPSWVNVHLADGRQFLETTTRLYDVVVLDAFLGEGAPLHLMTVEAFQAVQRHLRPDGVVLINSFGDAGTGKGFIVTALAKTLRRVFGNVRGYYVGNGNTFLVAANRAQLGHSEPVAVGEVHPEARAALARGFANELTFRGDSGTILRDDYNPADFYDAKNQEAARRSLAFALRR